MKRGDRIKMAGTALMAVAALSGCAGSRAGDAAEDCPVVKWEILPVEKYGGKCVERITVTGTDSVQMLCFNQLPRPLHMLSEGDTIKELLAGYYAITSPKFSRGDTAVFDVECEWTLRAMSELPESFHAITPGGRIIPAKLERQDILDAAALNPNWDSWRISADSLYRLNSRLAAGRTPGVFDIVPSFKKVEQRAGKFKAGTPIKKRVIANSNPEYYTITLTPDSAVIEGASENALRTAERMLERRLLEPNGGEIPCAFIEDYPDYPHRGVMIDIARNFQTPATMRRLVELLADYRLNRLHFHITDDEAWRLEIPGLPELTDYGSRRGFTLDEKSFLKQIFAGDGNPDSKEGTANGYFTRKEFISFLQHCDSLGIAVIPEVESPGHARAAVKAMEARLRNTGDDTYRMIIPGDTSTYTSAQLYHDNLMNPAAPGTYRFIDKVTDEIAAMYKEAGVALPGIHLGGDEVPDGAWDGSPEAVAMADSLGVSGRHGLHGAFVRKVADMMSRKGILLYGWQDIYTGYDAAHHAEVAPVAGGVNCWVSSHDPAKNVAIKGIKAGYPVILSNVDYFYLDMLYSPDPQERGLYWGGFVDELQSLSGYPDKICPPQPGAGGRIIGVQGQLFAETIRDAEMMYSLIFPKVFGLAERGWNGKPTYSAADFNILVGEKELPRLEREGAPWHLRMPGIIVEEGMVKMNSPYPSAEIRYTLDGTMPDTSSALYEKPFALPAGAGEVRAVLVKDSRKSAAALWRAPQNDGSKAE